MDFGVCVYVFFSCFAVVSFRLTHAHVHTHTSHTHAHIRYKKNLKVLCIVHPTFWVKFVFWLSKAFVSKKFFRKLHYIERALDLYQFFDPKTLIIPEHIMKYIYIRYYIYICVCVCVCVLLY